MADTKWAKPEPASTDLADIKAATTDERLVERAMIDFVGEFVRHIVRDKTPAEALATLDCWRDWLEKVREHSK